MISYEDQLIAVGALEAAINSGQPLQTGQVYGRNGAMCACGVIAAAYGYNLSNGDDVDPSFVYGFLDSLGFNVAWIHRANDESHPVLDDDGTVIGVRHGGFEAAREQVLRMAVGVLR